MGGGREKAGRKTVTHRGGGGRERKQEEREGVGGWGGGDKRESRKRDTHRVGRGEKAEWVGWGKRERDSKKGWRARGRRGTFRKRGGGGGGGGERLREREVLEGEKKERDVEGGD